jgi:arylsulfatase A-like enzyme
MKKPNIIFILADDMGWADPSCYGRPDYATPAIDRLAAEGARLTDCYSGSSSCSPTRISFLTGRYPARHPAGLAEPILPRVHGNSLGLEPEFPALPRLLAQAGYHTGLFGKWHCGEPPAFGPLKSGFDEYFGTIGTAAAYFSYKDDEGRLMAMEGEEPARPAGYLTDVLTGRACEFIVRNKHRPFYLSLHYTAPHWPWQARFQEEECGESISTMNGGSIEIYAEIMKALDEGVARLLRTLHEEGLEGNTLIVFTSDNGGAHYSYQYPLTGHIGMLREGGIRVPGIARWRGRIPAGQVCPQTAITMDWTATFLAIAGAEPDPRYPPDGINLMPVLSGAASPVERTLFWRTPTADAVRRGPWKRLRDCAGGKTQLFNLVRDIREYNDFSERYPKILSELGDAFAEWEETVLPRPAPQKVVPVPGVSFQFY